MPSPSSPPSTRSWARSTGSVARLDPERVQRAAEIVARYPSRRSALLPMLHLAQEQDGYLGDDAMEHIAELLELTPAEVECLAHCDKAPCLQVNYRFFGPLTPDGFDRLCDDLRSRRLERDVPRHGVLNRDTRPHPMSAARDGT